MDRKPVIGITPYKRKVAPYDTYIPEGFMKMAERLDIELRMLDYTKVQMYELLGEAVQVDGFIFSGGVDVDPALYGEEIESDCGAIDRQRDDIEINLFPLLLTRSIPILGICRGCQVINVAFGGTLRQHIPNHHQDDANGRFCHEISIVPGTKLNAIMGKTHVLTNSYHHQCVKELAPGFVMNAFAPDGTPEGFEAAMGTFIMGLQWHPEVTVNDDEDSLKPFAAFLEAVKKHMNAPCHG